MIFLGFSFEGTFYYIGEDKLMFAIFCWTAALRSIKPTETVLLRCL